MSNTIISPNMNLPVPVVGVDPGPDWASNIVICLGILDGHNHTSGQGVPIVSSAININADLPINNYNLVLARSYRVQFQNSLLAGASDLGCLYGFGVDLYYNDGSGNQVRLTQSGGVAGSPGSIASLASPASATWVVGSLTFVWQSAASTPANMDFASAIFRNLTANSKGLTMNPPNAMAANYTLTLPTLPAAQNFMLLDASGNITATVPIANGITRSMMSGVAQQISSTISFSTSSATYVLVTNSTISITTSGRPVVMFLQGAISISGAIDLEDASLAFSRDGGSTFIFEYEFSIVGTPSSGQLTSIIPGGSIMTFDTPAAGTYTYGLYVKKLAVGTTVFIGGKVIAWEL